LNFNLADVVHHRGACCRVCTWLATTSQQQYLRGMSQQIATSSSLAAAAAASPAPPLTAPLSEGSSRLDKKKIRPKKNKEKPTKSTEGSIAFGSGAPSGGDGISGLGATNTNPTITIDDKYFYKIEIRKLPPSDYNEKNFKESLEFVMRELSLPFDDLLLLHFMEGKLRSVCLCLFPLVGSLS
jgi:hypothetical protein